MTTPIISQLRAMRDHFGHVHLDRAQATMLMHYLEVVGEVLSAEWQSGKLDEEAHGSVRFATLDLIGTLPDAPALDRGV